jgi:hypothetical protein
MCFTRCGRRFRRDYLLSIAATRIVFARIVQRRAMVAFASAEDLTGENADRNSEIFLFDGAG